MPANPPETADRRSSSVLQSAILAGTLMLFWLMLMGSVSNDILIVGLLASVGIVVLFRKGLSFFTEFRATPEAFIAGVLYYGYFFKELVRSEQWEQLVASLRKRIVELECELATRPPPAGEGE